MYKLGDILELYGPCFITLNCTAIAPECPLFYQPEMDKSACGDDGDDDREHFFFKAIGLYIWTC